MSAEEARRGTVPVITIDGPSGAGKGTVSRAVAAALGFRLLDSGALYRLVALAGRRRGIPLAGPESAAKLGALAEQLDIRFEVGPAGEEVVCLEGREVTRDIRTEQAGNDASKVAALPEVRRGLLERQRAFVEPPGLIADGRDMGTVVFPRAALKIYLTASPEERALRRHKQLKEKGVAANLAALSLEIAERDRRDMSRPVAPLVPSADAVMVDTTGLSVEAVVGQVLALVRTRLALPGDSAG